MSESPEAFRLATFLVTAARDVVDEPAIYGPRHTARRITAQVGSFTLHPARKGKFKALEHEDIFRDFLWKLTVPLDRRDPLRGELNRCGINEASLFGDLPALCSHLTWVFEEEPGSEARLR